MLVIREDDTGHAYYGRAKVFFADSARRAASRERARASAMAQYYIADVAGPADRAKALPGK